MRLRLSSRLILSVVLIEAVMLSALVWNSVRLISSSHGEILERYTREQSLLLANSLAPGLAANDRAMLLDALALLEGNQHLVYVSVLDAAGQPMASVGPRAAAEVPDRGYADAERDGVFDIRREIDLYGQRLGTLQVGYSTDFIRELTAKTGFQNTAIALGELTLSVIATILLGLFLTRSLRRLEQGARAFGSDRLDHRIPVDGNDELSDVARSFNKMAQRLSESRAALEEQNALLQKQARHFEALLDGVDAVIMEADPDARRFLYVSQEGEAMLGYALEQWYAPGFWAQIVHPEDQDRVATWRTGNAIGSFRSDYRLRHRDGHYLWVRDISTVEQEHEGRRLCRGLLVDVTEQKRSEEQLLFLADHDPLTGRFNRRRFQEELSRCIARAKRYGEEGALMFIDLDQFKYINDTLGHAVGDAYLYEVSTVLGRSLREVDVLGRLGGDEFGVILPLAGLEQAQRVAELVIERLAALPVHQGERPIPVTASVGIALFPRHGETPGDLLARADAAMYTAKESGRNRYHVFSHDDRELRLMQAKMEWEGKIRRALDQDGFVLHYQPVFDLTTEEVSHYEVLLRMRDEDGTLHTPAAFLDTAERFGLIREIDYWVLRKAMEVQAQSAARGSPVALAVNLSGRHFNEAALALKIEESLLTTGAEPRRLIFEITETAAVSNINEAAQFVRRLHDAGCRVALDDFGVGYSSFHYLKHLPIDMVKIDGSFIRSLDTDQFDRVFVRAMGEVARGLNIATVGEFVENGRVVTVMRSLGIQYGQGYYLARPGPDFLAPHARYRVAAPAE